MPFGKRVDGPGGQRSAAREDLVLRAAMISAGGSRTAALMDISPTGAKLNVYPLPAVGKDVLIRVGRFEAFGTVVWSGDGRCGVHFDEPISAQEVELLRQERGVMTLVAANTDQTLGAQDWVNGMVR